jgi:hypothetical protein
MSYGVCPHPECSLSYHSNELNVLSELLAALASREFEHRDTAEISAHLNRFGRFFQLGNTCAQCRSALEIQFIRMAGKIEPEEMRARKQRLEDVLGCRDELVKRGVLV